MRKIIKVLGVLVALVIIGLSTFVGWSLYPHENLLPLPSLLVSHDSAAGAERLRTATSKTDYEPLSDWYQAQSLVSYCGVASGVTVLGALGIETTQSDFFTDKATQVRSRMNVVFGGMSLPDLAGLLGAHGLKVSLHHADGFNVAQFRETLEKNLANADDYLIINYQREVLGQGTVGHISPVAAYDRTTDSVLIMDSAAHKYPSTWAPLSLVYAAMQTTDTASGMMRGYIEVSK
jgi:hypothetical protein